MNGTIDCSCHNIRLGYVPSSLVVHMNHTDRQHFWSSVLMVGPGVTCMSPERMIANMTFILAAGFFCGEFSFWRRFRFVSAQKDMDDIKWLTWWTGVNGSITFSLTLRMFTKHFFQNLTVGYITKTLIRLFFFSSTKIRIFFSATLGIRIFF